MNPLRRRIVLVVVIALHLAADLAAVPIIHRWKLGDGNGFAWTLLYGLLLGQLSLLAGYWACGAGHWFGRALYSCCLMVLVWFAVAVGAVSTGDSFEVSSIEQVLAVVIAPSFGFLALAHWLSRRLSHTRYELLSGDPQVAKVILPRYQVTDLLAWTVAVAVLCAVFQTSCGRSLWAKPWSWSSGDWGVVLGFTALSSAIAAAIAIPAVGTWLSVFLSARRVMFFAGYATIVTVITSTIAYAIWGDPRFGVAVAGVPLGVICEVVACGLVFRLCGYRLVWNGSN